MKARPPEATISVVVAAYNSGHLLRATVDSMLAQTYPPSEIIVVDDGSTDDTARVARSYGGRVRVLSEPHRGQPAARNAGVLISEGDFIAFCDSDDIWHPRKLEAQIKLSQTGGFAWVICEAGWMHRDGTPAQVKMPPSREGDVLASLFLGNFIKSATPLIRREVFEVVGGFNEAPQARIGEDWDMWLRIAARYPLGVVHETLATVRIHENSMLATSTDRERVQGLAGVVARAAIREPGRLGHLRKRAMATIWHQAGIRSFRANRLEDSSRYFRRALQCQPWHLEARMYLLLCQLGPGAAQTVARLRKHLW